MAAAAEFMVEYMVNPFETVGILIQCSQSTICWQTGEQSKLMLTATMSTVVPGLILHQAMSLLVPLTIRSSKCGMCMCAGIFFAHEICITFRDRRSLGASGKPSGVLIGHTEGITYVSAKGDGRYVISNGKDQTVRLWDLRKMRTSAEYEEVEGQNYGSHFDYRYVFMWKAKIQSCHLDSYPPYPRPKYSAHPLDCSVMTYRGHSVLRTLIRCHFSPAETTGARYIYSGSADGRIHVSLHVIPTPCTQPS